MHSYKLPLKRSYFDLSLTFPLKYAQLIGPKSSPNLKWFPWLFQNLTVKCADQLWPPRQELAEEYNKLAFSTDERIQGATVSVITPPETLLTLKSTEVFIVSEGSIYIYPKSDCSGSASNNNTTQHNTCFFYYKGSLINSLGLLCKKSES